MTGAEIDEVLRSMTIVHDTREQDTARARRRYELIGLPVETGVLDYGDYTYNATLPTGARLYDLDRRIIPKCAIERKMHLDELASCLTRSRKRFEAEMERCSANNARMIWMIEDATWENLVLGRYRTKFPPNAYLASIAAWAARYDVQVIMCKEDTSPTIMREFLQKDLRERLLNGEFG